MKKRFHYFFSGTVQGVGFRWKAEQLALRFGISGWVRNCMDGRVEMEAQGEEEVLASFINSLDSMSFIHIEEIQKEEVSLKKDEHYFYISD